jgi:hypothetical protein
MLFVGWVYLRVLACTRVYSPIVFHRQPNTVGEYTHPTHFSKNALRFRMKMHLGDFEHHEPDVRRSPHPAPSPGVPGEGEALCLS